MNYAATEVANDFYTDRLKRRQDLRDAQEAARAEAIYAEVHAMAECAKSDPAEQARLIADAEVPLTDLRVTLHGESMTFVRAVCDLLHMAARLDDPEAIKCAAEAIREEIDTAIRRDAGVYGIAAAEVALGE